MGFMVKDGKNQLWSTRIQDNMVLQPSDSLKISILVNHSGDAHKSSQHLVVGKNGNKATIFQNPAAQHSLKCGNNTVTQTGRCDAAQTSVNGVFGYCQNQLIFEENFDSATLDTTKWSYDIRSLSTGKITEEFAVFDSRDENIFLRDGYLNIRPTFTKDDMRQASINFGSRCTPVSTVRRECKMSSMSPFLYVPPVNSSQIHTRNAFNFKYGRVEIKAKLPKGDWLLPCKCKSNVKL